MLKYNSYLKEIGVKKSAFPFKKELDRRYFDGKKTGIAEVETWNLDMTLIMVLYSYLRRYKEVNNGFPARMTEKEWDDKLDDMIKGFEDYIKWSYDVDNEQNSCTCDEYFTEEEKYRQGVNNSMVLLTEYLFDLGW